MSNIQLTDIHPTLQGFTFPSSAASLTSLGRIPRWSNSRGGHACVGTNGYVRLTGMFFSAFYEQEGCTKMGTTEQEGSLKWCSDEPRGPRVRSTDTLEQEGVNNLKHVFHESMNRRGRGSGGLASHTCTFPDLVTLQGSNCNWSFLQNYWTITASGQFIYH